MRKNQSGVTMIGWLLIIAIFGVFALAAIKLVPIYLESLKVSSVLQSLETEHDGNRPTTAALRKSLQTRFNIESVRVIKSGEVNITPGANGSYIVRAKYEHKTPFIGNLGLVVSVDHKVEISR